MKRSPCAACPNMGRYESDRCRRCGDRIAYLASIGDMSASLPIEATDLGRRRAEVRGTRIEKEQTERISAIRFWIQEKIDDVRDCKPAPAVCADCGPPDFEARDDCRQCPVTPAAVEPTKVCSRSDCEHGGKPQPLSDFDNHPTTRDGKASHCKDCRRKIIRNRRKKKRRPQTPAPPRRPDPPGVIEEVALAHLLRLRPELMESLSAQAALAGRSAVEEAWRIFERSVR